MLERVEIANPLELEIPRPVLVAERQGGQEPEVRLQYLDVFYAVPLLAQKALSRGHGGTFSRVGAHRAIVSRGQPLVHDAAARAPEDVEPAYVQQHTEHVDGCDVGARVAARTENSAVVLNTHLVIEHAVFQPAAQTYRAPSRVYGLQRVR